MPDIAVFHPQIVHVVIVGAGIGIFFRWVSLTGKFQWTSPAATSLLVLGAFAAWLAVESGTQAHGVAERIPGAARAVQLHEDAGHDTWRVLMIIALVELAALTPWVAKWRRWLLVASGLIGVFGAYEIYDVGHLGGEVVYAYAGGVGTRSGDSTDVNRLVVAALYDRATLSRTQKNAQAAAQGFDDLAARFPGDPTIRLLAIESMIQDKKDPGGALAALDKMPAPSDTSRLYTRYFYDRSDAFVGVGQKDSARAILNALMAKFPQRKQQITARLDRIK